jgi:pyruvate/2-oxoglutarate dehydrogenase complex dihydrolipoamide dehydrogenase (E3) component
VDRGIVDGTGSGYVKIHVAKGRDQILDATIVGEHAGDMISEISVAIQGKMGLFVISLRVMKHRSDSWCDDIVCTL